MEITITIPYRIAFVESSEKDRVCMKCRRPIPKKTHHVRVRRADDYIVEAFNICPSCLEQLYFETRYKNKDLKGPMKLTTFKKGK